MRERPFDIRKRSFDFAKDVIRFVKNSVYEKRYYSIFEQLLKSGTSIGSNIEEGTVASSAKDLMRFNTLALRSVNETRYWLKLIRETEISEIDISHIDELIKESEALANKIASILIKIRV